MLEILVKKGLETVSLDLFQETIVSVNYSIATIKNISETNGSYTKTIQLPATPTNRKVFGFITDMATDTSYNYGDYTVKNYFNPNIKVKCWLLEDSITILEGYIQFNKYIISDTDNDTIIEATVYADNTNFYISMGDDLLTDIDFSEYNFVLTPAGITASWTNDITTYQKGYYFPLIDYGHGWTLEDLQDQTTYKLNVKDFLPAIFVKTIWDKIFAEHNYNYKSKFLGSRDNSSIPDPRFGNLVIPYYQQTFQNNVLFNQDKIFHMGLSNSTLDDSYYRINTYMGKYNTSLMHPAEIVNSNLLYPGYEYKKLWFTGNILNPFATDPARNTGFVATDTVYSFVTYSIPFNGTASPMFNNYQNGGNTYDTTNHWYQNRSDTPFKQRFVLKTDVVTTYSINNFIERGHLLTGSSPFFPTMGYDYNIRVEFFREIDPNTGTVSTLWASGTGYNIPADLGPDPLSGAYLIAHTLAGVTDSTSFWICDKDYNSNVFTSAGKLIVPTGTNRYLGELCTNATGSYALTFSSDGAINFRKNSGDCVTWYYNDAYNQTPTTPANRLQGLWVSGIDGYSYNASSQATLQPDYGDWYQGLQLQTIFLDGDSTNEYYGAAGSLCVNGNVPIQPNEKVRCVIIMGSKYKGQQVTSTPTSYKPPVCAYLLSSTQFDSGSPIKYNYSTGVPLTQFYNDVSPDYVTGQTINFNTIIPKNIKQRDFIQDIIRIHNLYVEPDKSTNKFPNTLIIEPRDDYYKLADSSLDWRDKLDITQPIDVKVLAETQYRRTLFTYKADNDYYNKQYTQNTYEIYGQYANILDNEFLTDQLKIESMFSPTPMTQIFSYQYGNNTLLNGGGFVMPVLVSGNNIKPNSNGGPNGSIQTNLRLLYKNMITSKNDDLIYIFGQKTNLYPYAGPYDNPYTPSYSLNWGQTRGEFFAAPTDQFFDNLVNTYWASLLTEMGDEDSRMVTCSMFLNAKDINDFYFYKLVFLTIDGVDGYYKVDNIEGYIPGENNVCKVTLLKSKSFLPTKLYRGSSSTMPPGIIIIHPGGGGGVVISGTGTESF
jgi:hypothetical protein